MPTDRLAALELTYAEVRGTRAALPPGYHHLDVRRVVGRGDGWFDEAARRLLTWDVQRRAGIEVDAARPVALGARATLVVGLGPLRVRAPVEVVDVVAGPNRVGFAYGTLQGHPEQGEERFELELQPDGDVAARICAFSRPGRWFTRLGGPLGRALQRTMTQRYLDAMSQPAPRTGAPADGGGMEG